MSHVNRAVKPAAKTKLALVPRDQEPVTTSELRASVERYMPVPLESLLHALKSTADERMHRFVTAVHDPAHQSYSLAELCREVGIQPQEIGEAWKQHQLNTALARMFRHLPEVLDDTAVDARARDALCPECGGTGEIANRKTRKRSRCAVCDGMGKVRIAGDHKARGLVFEAAGLIGRQQPVVAIQQNFGLDMSLEETVMMSQRIINETRNPPQKE